MGSIVGIDCINQLCFQCRIAISQNDCHCNHVIGLCSKVHLQSTGVLAFHIEGISGQFDVLYFAIGSHFSLGSNQHIHQADQLVLQGALISNDELQLLSGGLFLIIRSFEAYIQITCIFCTAGLTGQGQIPGSGSEIESSNYAIGFQGFLQCSKVIHQAGDDIVYQLCQIGSGDISQNFADQGVLCAGSHINNIC